MSPSISPKSEKKSQKAQKTGVTRRKALVLGDRAIAQIIAQQFEEEGFEPVFQSSLPSTVDSQGLDEIRRLLSEFAKDSEGHGIVHPGTTFWADRPELASIGEALGLSVVSPPSRLLSFFGNKLNFLFEADRIGVPHLVQSFDPIHSVREIEDFIQRTGQTFPFVLKAVKGGGSFGLFVVMDEAALEKTVPLWFDQLRRKLGEVILFAERYIEGARHVAVPFARFQDGRIEVFPISDVSLQSRYRKVIEFCPATRVDGVAQKHLTEWTKKTAENCGYVGVGVLEFLVDSSRTFLVEGLARLNTGFHLWETIAGTQAVSWQLATLLAIRQNYVPSIKPFKGVSSGVLARIYAEDALLHLPHPGLIHEISFPDTEENFENSQVSLHLKYQVGDEISVFDSGLVGLLFVYSQSRKQAVAMAVSALKKLWIAGSLQTNERFILELLSHPWVREEVFHAGFVDEEFLPEIRPSSVIVTAVVLACAEHPAFQASHPHSRPSDLRWFLGDQPIKFPPQSISSSKNGSKEDSEIRKPLYEWVEGPSYWNYSTGFGASGLLEMSDGQQLRVCSFPLSEERWLVRVGPWFMSLRTAIPLSISKTQFSSVQFQSGERRLSALVSGRVHAILFRAGVLIPAHEPFLIIESCGIFVPHALPVSIRVTQWKVKADDIVRAGQDLAQGNLNLATS